MVLVVSMTPVMNVDPSGEFPILVTTIGILVGIVVGGTVGGIVAYNYAINKGLEGNELLYATLGGIAIGALIGGVAGYGAGLAFTKATGIIGYSVTKFSIVPIKGVTILGSYDLYIESAKATNSGYYDIGGKFEKLSKAQNYINNITYLKDANELGSKFAVHTAKVTQYVNGLWFEIKYLIEHKIPWEMF